MPVPIAQLRIYTPLDAFPVGEQARWRAVLDERRGLTRFEVADLESWVLRQRLLGRAVAVPTDAARVRRMGDRPLISPLDLDARAGAAFAALEKTVPRTTLAAMVPDGNMRERLLDAARTPPHVLDHPFAVPLAWYAAFQPDERRFLQPPGGTAARLLYLTFVGQALRRLERVLDVVVDQELGDEELTTSVSDLAVWLTAFDEDGVLELDHASVGVLRGPAALRVERSCADLWEVVEALEGGDELAAAAIHARARARWAHANALASAS